MTKTARPPIDTIQAGADLRPWYWTKSELMAEARRRALSPSGGKFDILARLCAALDGTPPPPRKPKTTSGFDWHRGPITAATVITDSYASTQSVRRFFKAELGADFHFTIALMDWIKSHTGLTMADALHAAQRLRIEAAAPGFKTQIKPHNQWNAYQRAFLADNPGASLAMARAAWAKKRAQPSPDGRHVYDRTDLSL